jgi:hypothetical protein
MRAIATRLKSGQSPHTASDQNGLRLYTKLPIVPSATARGRHLQAGCGQIGRDQQDERVRKCAKNDVFGALLAWFWHVLRAQICTEIGALIGNQGRAEFSPFRNRWLSCPTAAAERDAWRMDCRAASANRVGRWQRNIARQAVSKMEQPTLTGRGKHHGDMCCGWPAVLFWSISWARIHSGSCFSELQRGFTGN